MPKSPTTPQPWLTGQRKLLIGGVVVFLSLAYFMFQAFQGATVYYYTVEELQQRGAAVYGESLRVKGKLVADSFQRVPGTTEARFLILDENGDTLNATYQGALPDLFFNEHSELILQGTYQPDGIFSTDNILVKCPTKYQELESSPQGDAVTS